MNMKKIIALVLVLCLALALCACGGGKAKEESNVIKIGVYEPQSGDNGAGGKQEILGMQYANYKTPTVEVGGKTYNVELVIADNESSNDKAVSAATKLISSGCSVVLGSYGSGVSIAASDTFAEAGLAAIGVTCTNPQVTQGNDHYFRICFLDPFQGTVLANFAHDTLGAKTAYCLGQLGNDYDQGLVNYFKQAAEALGMKVVTAEFPENNSDFTSYLTSAKNEGADVIFAPCSISYAQLIVEQADAQGIQMPLLAGDTWDSNAILAAAEGKNVQIYVSTFYAEGGDPDFEKGIKEWLNSNSEAMTNNGGNDMIAAVSVMGYDAYYTALEAIKKAGSADKADILATLPSVTLSGVSGAIAFDDTGDAIRDSAYIKQANTSDVVWDFVTVAKVG
ncbi:MAG: amino acid ABC transporter substrate-binding protein [Ruminococcaceae bacterium]|jgi:branched-chain amino acid transport system substrate-binding protein|nr:amino acid ABC transporter substrate-binding protein [Oscillospiraceae bacterium]